MAQSDPIGEVNPDFSEPSAAAPPWADVQALLERSEMFWLSTTRADGRPHVTPLPAIWCDGALHICTGDREQKYKNLDRDPRCILTTGTNEMNTGMDVVVEGTAVRVTEQARLRELADLWKAQLDWDFEVGEDAFRDEGGRHGIVFAIAPTKVLVFDKGHPFGQVRYRFDR